jgi:hypothetical protein
MASLSRIAATPDLTDQVRQTAVQRLLCTVGNGLEQGQGDLKANDRHSLERCLTSRGRRSMRAASTAWTVAGT